jgi:hypothetical protein
MPALSVQIVRWVDDYQPGIVACEFEDAEGHCHVVIDKVPIVTAANLDAASRYPQPGAIRCEILARWRDAQGRELVRISTARPDAVESTEGLSQFVVFASQLPAEPGSDSPPPVC